MSYKLIAVCVLVLIVGVVPLPAQTDRGSVIVALFVQDIVDYNQQSIDLSRIALGRATSRAVLNHARDVINYATKSNALFRHYAAKNGLALRETPESSLSLNAADFEMDYMKTATDGDSRTATLLQGQYDLNFGDFELHQLIGQQLQRPAAIPRRRLPQPHRNQFRFALAVQLARRRRRRTFLAFQRGVKTLRDQSLTKVFHSPHRTTISLRDLRIRPSRPIHIRLE